MKENITLVECLGTRYYRVAVLKGAYPTECLLVAFLQSPLSSEEIQRFVKNRIGKDFTVIATQVSKETAECSEEKIRVIPLCNFELLLKPLTPEVVVDVTYAKITRTNKGTLVQMPIDPETGEIKRDE